MQRDDLRSGSARNLLWVPLEPVNVDLGSRISGEPLKGAAEMRERELKELASSQTLPPAERRRRIAWTFDMAGF